MPDITLASYEQRLLTRYDKEKIIKPFFNEEVPFTADVIDEVPDLKNGGNVVEFGVVLAIGYGVGNPNDGAAWSPGRPHIARKCQVGKAQIDSTLRITVEANAAGERGDSFDDNALTAGTSECLTAHAVHMNTLFLGHGTGRLGIVDADVVAGTVITLSKPYMAFMIRRNMYIEFADADTGGSVQNLGAPGTEVLVSKVDYVAGTITVASAITVSAGWGIYWARTYGHRMPNGLQGIVDNNRLTSTIYNLSRADNEEMNATVVDPGDGLADYSEEYIRDGLIRSGNRCSGTPTGMQFWSNAGIVAEHFRATTKDRIFNVNVGESIPKYQTGGNRQDIAYHFDGVAIPFKQDKMLPARTLYGVLKSMWRKYNLIEAGWMKLPGRAGFLEWEPAAGGGNYGNAMIGSYQENTNIVSKYPVGEIVFLNIRDRASARD